MPGLLATQIGADPPHLFQHVAVAHLGLQRPDTRLAQRAVQAEVGHDRGDDQAALQLAARRQMAGADGQNVIPVSHLPGLIHRDEAVAVAVEGQADPDSAGPHLFLEGFGVESAGAPVDVRPIGPDPEGHDPRSETPEQARRQSIGRAVRAVQGDSDPVQPEVGAPPAESQIVRLGPVIHDQTPHAPAVGPRRRVRSAQPRLDLVFPRVRQFGAVAREDLDAVVLEGVVGGREDDPAVSLEVAREKGHGGGRQHAHRVALRSRRQAAGHQRGLQHGTRQARIPPDDEPDRRRSLVLQQGGNDLTPEAVGCLGDQRLPVRHAADPVGAEEPGHARSPFMLARGSPQRPEPPGGSRPRHGCG